MYEFFLQTFVILFVIIDPVAVIPLFVALTRNDTLETKRRLARRAAIIGTILLLSFGIMGDKLLDFMNISEPAFRIAGGFLLLLIAIEMVLGRPSGIRSSSGDEEREVLQKEDISVFPLAIPFIAGPGSLTSIIVLVRHAETIGFYAKIGVFIILLMVAYIVYLSLRMSELLLKILGITGANVVTRVFGIILAAVAMQNIIDSIITIIHAVPH